MPVGVGDGERDRLIDDVSAVQKEALIASVGFVVGAVADIPPKAHPVLFGADGDAVLKRPRAVHDGERTFEPVAEGAVAHLAVDEIGEGNFGAGEKEARHDGGDVPFLARVALQEFEAGGRVIKEVFDGDDGALRAACGGNFAEDAPLYSERVRFLPLRAGEDGRLGY